MDFLILVDIALKIEKEFVELKVDKPKDVREGQKHLKKNSYLFI